MIDLNSATARWRLDLTADIRLNDLRDDLDWNYGNFPEVPNRHIQIDHPTVPNQTLSTSAVNLAAIKLHLDMLGSDCKNILEIGVDEGNKNSISSTRLFIDNKATDALYLGIDINDKEYLNDADKNVHTYQIDSTSIEKVMQYAYGLGVKSWDFIYIDGWHSINQVLKEWEYTRWLSPHGIVGVHDTAIHPGPHMFLKYLDRTKWHVIENACALENNDYGVGFARLKLY